MKTALGQIELLIIAKLKCQEERNMKEQLPVVLRIRALEGKVYIALGIRRGNSVGVWHVLVGSVEKQLDRLLYILRALLRLPSVQAVEATFV